MRYFGYGYLWWVWDSPNNKGAYEGAYTAQGNFGQYISVLPALDLVIAHKTKAAYERYTSNYLTILNKLVAANNSELSTKNKWQQGGAQTHNMGKQLSTLVLNFNLIFSISTGFGKEY